MGILAYDSIVEDNGMYLGEPVEIDLNNSLALEKLDHAGNNSLRTNANLHNRQITI